MTESIFRALLDTSWRASWLIAALLILQLCLRRRIPARVSYWLSLALVLRLWMPFAVPASWSPFPSEVRQARPAHAVTQSPSARATDTPATAAMRSSTAAGETGPTESWCVVSPWSVAALMWLGGAVVLSGMRLAAGRRFAARVRRSAQATPAALSAEVRRQFRGVNVRVTVTDAVATPALIGLVRPHLLFPPGMAEALSRDELKHIVAHELGHHRRHDLLALRLAQFATVLHWFNPLAWVVARQVRRDCELACDEAVLAGLGQADRAEYGQTLLRILSFTHGAQTPRFALGVVESKQQLKQRIHMIAVPTSAAPIRTVLVCAATATCLLVSVTRSSHAQPVVTSPDGKITRNVSTEQAVDPAADGLDQQFPTGVVAVIGQQTITVADVRREIAPLIPMLRRDSKTPEQYELRVRLMKNSVIKDLIGRQLLIKDFQTPPAGEAERRLAPEMVDRAVADRIREQFSGDQARFHEYLNGRGMTPDDFRKTVEEDIIYSYMRKQERTIEGDRKAAVAQAADHTGKVHLRLIQIARNDRSDEALQNEAGAVLARFRNGERFDSLAREVSVDSRRSKGGDWGWLGEKDFRPEVWSHVQPLQAGQVSAPVLLKEGCFLLYVEERG